MALAFRPLHPLFAAEVGAIDLRRVQERAMLDEIRAGMDRYAVLVFREQPLSDADQLAFAQRFDGKLHSKTGSSVLGKNRPSRPSPTKNRKTATAVTAYGNCEEIWKGPAGSHTVFTNPDSAINMS